MRRILLPLCVMGMAVTTIWGTYLALVPHARAAHAARVTIENASQDLGNVPEGKNVITFRVVNPTTQPVRILPSPGKCNKICCFGQKDEPEELVVLPGTTAEVQWILHTKPLPFAMSGEMYVMGENLWILPVEVRGIGMPLPVNPR